MSQAWYEDGESTEQIENDLEKFRAALNNDERQQLAAYLLEGQDTSTVAGANRQPPAKREPIPAEEEKQPATSAEILAGFREGRTHKSDPDAAQAFFAARINETWEASKQ
jgi:hypothetical protein